jgi:hypothetical protein
MYDFRDNRARVWNGDWRSPELLMPNEVSELLRLIRMWERMMLARAGGASDARPLTAGS